MKHTYLDSNQEKHERILVEPTVIERCKARQQAAFADLYNASLPYVLHIVRGYITNEETLRDLVQEIYSKAFLAIDSYSSRKGPFRFWLRKVAVNQCLMHLRKSKRDTATIELSDELTRIPDINGQHAPDTFDLEKAKSMLNLMPTGYRTVFTLVVMNGYSHEEAGKELGISTQTSRSQLARGKKWLRNHLKSNKTLVNHG